MNRSLLWLLVLAMSTAACAGVLGLRPRARQPFEHRAHVLKGIPCARCHVGVATAGETGPLHVPAPAVCRTCHVKPHDEHACGECHGRAASLQGASEARAHLRFEHRTHVPRVKGDCVRCHVDIAHDGAALRPRMATCGSCHQHQAELAGRACDGCHVNLRTEGTVPDDHLAHEGDFLRRHGAQAAADRSLCSSCHAERFCAGCHGRTTPTLPERMAFDEPLRAGIHRAGFVSRHSDEARGDPGLCTTCHSPRACQDCHERKGVAARGTGRARFTRANGSGCVAKPMITDVPRGATRRSAQAATAAPVKRSAWAATA